MPAEAQSMGITTQIGAQKVSPSQSIGLRC